MKYMYNEVELNVLGLPTDLLLLLNAINLAVERAELSVEVALKLNRYASLYNENCIINNVRKNSSCWFKFANLMMLELFKLRVRNIR